MEHPFRRLIRIAEGAEAPSETPRLTSQQRKALVDLSNGPRTMAEISADVRTMVALANLKLVRYSGPSYKSRKSTFWSLTPSGSALSANLESLEEDAPMSSRKNVASPSEKSTDGSMSPLSRKRARKAGVGTRSFKALFSKK